MIFTDRTDAGIRLANALEKYKEEDVIVFALPRGGVVLGVEIANKLNAPLDLIITKKIGHPLNEEYAICAIAEEGEPVCNPAELRTIDTHWLAAATERIRSEIRRRRRMYMGDIPIYDVKGKTAIIVDDGIATGLTMFAAIAEIKKRRPGKIVVAIPVTPYSTAQKLKTMVDVLVSLECDDDYIGAVGAYYRSFNQLNDSEVISLLNSVKKK